jgi:3-oxoacyl-[acyl-carrier-protein] synthase II
VRALEPHRRVVVTGVGAVGPGCVGGAAAVEALVAGLAPKAGRAHLVDDAAIAGLLDDSEERRLSRICRFAVVAARLALRDARRETAEGLGLVLGSEHGDFRSTIAFADGYLDAGPAGLSALLFPSTVMDTMSAAATIAVAAREACLTLNAPTVAGHLAVAQAAAAVASGRLPAALAGGVDEIVDLVQEGLDAFEPSVLRGEGAAFAVLEPLESARARGAPVLGEVMAAAWRALPARPGGVGRLAAAPAIAAALVQAGVPAGRLGFVYTALNGDAPRDAWEAAVVGNGLSARVPPGAALAPGLGQQAALGPLALAAAAWTARTGRLPGDAGPVAAWCPGLVHALARGGNEVAVVVGPPVPRAGEV